MNKCIAIALILSFSGCGQPPRKSLSSPMKPAVVTGKVLSDTDDPAIWIDKVDPARSIILGTDKDKDNGGIYVFRLDGTIDRTRTVTGMKRVNNIDVAYGLEGNGYTMDIAVATERDRDMIRVFRLPQMKPVDNNGIPVFVGEEKRSPMGIALYTRPYDQAVFAIVGRKEGPSTGYLHQYRLEITSKGTVTATLVRSFGQFSGKKEIESIAVDNELGYVYYSDEQVGIRKYFADPVKGNEELALFGVGQFKEDNEGISIYKVDEQSGYILVSDQSANRFNIYPRSGPLVNKHAHRLLSSIPFSTNQSDGSDVTSVSLPGFEGGLFVAMSTDTTFQLYSWKDIAKRARLEVRK